jgi:hypothetical protein
MDTPYSNKDIEKILAGVLNCASLKIYEMDDLHKYNISEFLNSSNNFIVIFNKPSSGNIGHWTCAIIRNDNTIEYFDSFGNKSPYKNTKFKRYFRKHGFTIIENKKKLQLIDSNVCGKHIILRILARHKNLEGYLKIFKNKELNPDEIVKCLVSIEDNIFINK